ncbi:MAG: glycosyltransferase family 4 protein [Bacteroides thetaiotaomicron]|nr:glycosyltransferase family 4 protein [Bacteroides thetaiotaomicron]
MTVLFEKRGSDERDSSWLDYKLDNVGAVFLPGKSTGVAEAFCPSVVKWLRKDYDHIVVTNFSDMTGMLAVLWLKSHRKSYELESDGGFPGSGKGIKEKIKKFFISGAERYFSTAKIHDQYYMTYGTPSERIVRYPFTSLSDTDILKEPISEEEKANLKSKLNMTEKHIVLAVGQFIYRKGYDVLIKACADLKDTGVYMVGGEAPEEYLELVKKVHATNIHFVGFKQKQELQDYYLAADVFVHPTREDIWGLVVNEAMAKGLPVITTDKCVAGLELIIDERFGKIIKSDDTVALSVAIQDVLANLSPEQNIQILCHIANYTLDTMANCHIKNWGDMERR